MTRISAAGRPYHRPGPICDLPGRPACVVGAGLRWSVVVGRILGWGAANSLDSSHAIMSAAQAARMLDLALEDGQVRSPLNGLFPSDMPVPTLADALTPVCGNLPHLNPTIGTSVKLAQRHAKRALKKHPELTEDLASSIVLYTMEEQPRTKSLYWVLNEVLRSQDRDQVQPWRKYIWLLLHALRALPEVTQQTLYRGCKASPSDLQFDLDDDTGLPEKGFEFTWSAFSSTAVTQGVMSQFLGTQGVRTMLTLEMLPESCGRKIHDFSLFPQEDEVRQATGLPSPHVSPPFALLRCCYRQT